MVHFLGKMGVHFRTSKMLVMLGGAKHPVLGFQNEILRTVLYGQYRVALLPRMTHFNPLVCCSALSRFERTIKV
jgi:hypothetical protein